LTAPAPRGPRSFSQALKLQRLGEAWRCALTIGSHDAWRQMGVAALEALDVDTAAAAFRQARPDPCHACTGARRRPTPTRPHAHARAPAPAPPIGAAQAGDAGMVLSLQALEGVEDRALLAGHALVLLGRDADAAQELFLRSPRPLAALEMRRDLRHWPQALALARRLAPGEVPAVCRQHAGALEVAGDHAGALQHYQEARGVGVRRWWWDLTVCPQPAETRLPQQASPSVREHSRLRPSTRPALPPLPFPPAGS
jgi:WD repeat-containing protein 19